MCVSEGEGGELLCFCLPCIETRKRRQCTFFVITIFDDVYNDYKIKDKKNKIQKCVIG